MDFHGYFFFTLMLLVFGYWFYECLFLYSQYAKVHLLDTEGFGTTFGKKAQRKKPKLKTADMQVSMLCKDAYLSL